jgi:hypothetical protein
LQKPRPASLETGARDSHPRVPEVRRPIHHLTHYRQGFRPEGRGGEGLARRLDKGSLEKEPATELEGGAQSEGQTKSVLYPKDGGYLGEKQHRGLFNPRSEETRASLTGWPLTTHRTGTQKPMCLRLMVTEVPWENCRTHM